MFSFSVRPTGRTRRVRIPTPYKKIAALICCYFLVQPEGRLRKKIASGKFLAQSGRKCSHFRSDRQGEPAGFEFLPYKKNSSTNMLLCFGATGGIRTPDLSVRSRMLYPAELRLHFAESHFSIGFFTCFVNIFKQKFLSIFIFLFLPFVLFCKNF